MYYCKQHNNPLYIAFIDLKTAFYTVDSALQRDKLKQLGVSPNFISTLKILYKHTQRKVLWNKLTNTFRLTIWLHKGCHCRCYCSSSSQQDILVPQDLDSVWRGEACKHNNHKLKLCIYDIVIVTESQTDIAQALLTLTKTVKLLKLEINFTKSQIVTMWTGTSQTRQWAFSDTSGTVQGVIAEVKHYKYMGVTIQWIRVQRFMEHQLAKSNTQIYGSSNEVTRQPIPWQYREMTHYGD